MTLFAHRLAVSAVESDAPAPGRYDEIRDLRVDRRGRALVDVVASVPIAAAGDRPPVVIEATITKLAGDRKDEVAAERGFAEPRDLDDVMYAAALLVTSTRMAPGDVDT